MKDKILTTPSKDTVKSLSVFVEKHLGHLVLYAPKILVLGRHQNLPMTDQDNCCPPGCRAQAVGTDMHGITLQRSRPLSISVLSCRPPSFYGMAFLAILTLWLPASTQAHWHRCLRVVMGFAYGVEEMLDVKLILTTEVYFAPWRKRWKK